MHRTIAEANDLIRRRGLSLDRIADLVGKDRTAVFRQIGSEAANPTVSTLSEYEDALGAELHLVEKDICYFLREENTNDLRAKAISQVETISQLKAELQIQRDLAEQRLAHCRELDAQIAMLNEQINEKDAQITMLIKHITK